MNKPPVEYFGVFDVARASKSGLPTAKPTYKNMVRILSNIGFVCKDEIYSRDVWAANIAARVLYGGKYRTWRKNYFRLSTPYKTILRQKFSTTLPTFLGWELSPGMKRFFDENHLSYIDVSLSRIRFANDLLIDLSTNSTILAQEISRRVVCVSNTELTRIAQATIMDKTEHDTLIVVGQVAGDASLLTPNGQEMTLRDFDDQIRSLALQYQRVLYRPHPKGASDVDQYFRDIPRDPEPSIYTHMARGASFCAISSSTLEEAAVFGCPVFRLADRTFAELHGDPFVTRNVHVLRSADYMGQISASGEVPILRFVLGHNASDLGPLRN